MEARNCPKCGKFFTYVTSPLCSDCEKEEEKAYQKVKEFLKENPGHSLAETAQQTEVSVKKIMKYIREGRLEATHGMRGDIRCEACGKPIIAGRYCDSCVIKINQEVGELFSEKKKVARMHTMTKKL